MVKKSAEMESSNYMTAVNLWMTFHFLTFQNFLFFLKSV